MAAPFKQRRVSQPQQPTGIHPAWRQRGFRWLVNGSDSVEIGHNIALSATNGANLSTGRSGKQLLTNVAQASYNAVIPSVPTAECTMLWYGDLLTVTDANASLAGFPHDLADGSPYASVVLGRQRSGSVSDSLCVYISDASGSLNLIETAAGYIGTAICIIITIKDGEQKFYVNGQLTDTFSVSLPGGLWQPPVKYVDVGNGGTARNPAGATALWAASDQVITALEIQALSTNPWQLFAPASRNFPIDAGTVTPPPPIDVEGFWDETLTAQGWFDETLQAGGWVDTQLLDVVASSGLSGAVTETLTLSDSQAATASVAGAVAETLTFTDSQAGRATWPVAVSETLSLSDSQTGTLVFVGAVAETLSLSDSQAAAATLAGAVADTLTLSDSQAATLATGAQAVAETLALSDSQTGAATWPVAVVETLTFTDSQNATVAGATNSVAETLSLSDSQAAAATLVGAVAETITFTDSQAGRATWPVVVSETLSLSDSQDATNLAGGTNSVTETLSLSDSQAATALLAGAVAETLALSDSQAATLATGTQAVAETLTLSDSQTGLKTTPAVVSETLTFTDSQVGQRVIAGLVSEVLTFSDNQAAFAAFMATVLETLSFSDSQVSDGGVTVVAGAITGTPRTGHSQTGTRPSREQTGTRATRVQTNARARR